VSGPPLNEVTGGVIFPVNNWVGPESDIDIFYATRPGDPAYEAPEKEATKAYNGIFTKWLLKTVQSPGDDLIDMLENGAQTLKVITSRKLKPYLETTVPIKASDVDIRLRQTPVIRVETALPKFFALLPDKPMRFRGPSAGPPPAMPNPTSGPLIELGTKYFENTLKTDSVDFVSQDKGGIEGEVQSLVNKRGREKFETRTGFSVFGAKPIAIDALNWSADEPFLDPGNEDAWHIRLRSKDGYEERNPSTIVIEFDKGTGVPLPILPGFIGTVVVDQGRVISVSFVPSGQTGRYEDYREHERDFEEMKALANVFARHGRFMIAGNDAIPLANRIRQGKGLIPRSDYLRLTLMPKRAITKRLTACSGI